MPSCPVKNTDWYNKARKDIQNKGLASIGGFMDFLPAVPGILELGSSGSSGFSGEADHRAAAALPEACK